MKIKTTKKVKRQIAKLIFDCFDGVKFTKQSFCFNGEMAKDNTGHNLFYNSNEIDKGMKNIDKLIIELRK